MTKYNLRSPEYLDLARGDHWRFQKRDKNGMWTDEGGVAKHAVKALASSIVTKSSTTTTVDSAAGTATRHHRESVARSLLTSDAAKTTKQKIQTWHLEKEEREEMFANNHNDPLPDLSEADLFEHLHGSDKEMRQKALDSITARHQRLSFLAEVAHDGVRNADTREKLAKWDSKVAKVPGGKGLLRLRDRLVSEKALFKLHKAKEDVKGWAKDSSVHLGVYAALGVTLSLAGGMYAMLHGGDPEAVMHAQHAVEALFHSGSLGVGSATVGGIISWQAAQLLVTRIAKKAAKAKQIIAPKGAHLAR